jgi:hypothetical protein
VHEALEFFERRDVRTLFKKHSFGTRDATMNFHTRRRRFIVVSRQQQHRYARPGTHRQRTFSM